MSVFLESYLFKWSVQVVWKHKAGRYGPRKAEVTNFNLTVSINENIGRFDISVHDAGRVDKVQCTKGIVQYDQDVFLRKLNLFATVEHLLQVRVDVVHDYEHIVVLQVLVCDDVKHLGGMLVIRHRRQVSQNLNLTDYLSG